MKACRRGDTPARAGRFRCESQWMRLCIAPSHARDHPMQATTPNQPDPEPNPHSKQRKGLSQHMSFRQASSIAARKGESRAASESIGQGKRIQQASEAAHMVCYSCVGRFTASTPTVVVALAPAAMKHPLKVAAKTLPVELVPPFDPFRMDSWCFWR